jgi:hypothetical protein
MVGDLAAGIRLRYPSLVLLLTVMLLRDLLTLPMQAMI